MNNTLEPTATEEFTDTTESHRVTDRRVVNLATESREPLSEELAVEIALSIGVTRDRVHQLWAEGKLRQDGLDWHVASELAVRRGTSVQQIDKDVVALLGGTSADLVESIRLQREADELAAKASARRDAAIAKRQAHVQLKANVEKAREALGRIKAEEARMPGAIAELKDIIARMIRGENYGARVHPPHFELAGALVLKAEIPAIRKSAEAVVAKAEKALSEFESANGITSETQEAA